MYYLSDQILSGPVDDGGGEVIVCIYIPCQEEKLVADFYNNYQSTCLAH